MFRPLPIYIGLRYLRAKKRSGFVSFISLASVIGIALGVTVLITVLSVMNGFDDEIRNHIFRLAPHIIVSNSQKSLPNWQNLKKKIAKTPKVLNIAPLITKQGMISSNGLVSGVMLSGVDPKLETGVSLLGNKMVQGKLSSLQPNKFHVILGLDLAAELNAGIGDKITLITPQATFTPLGIMPRFKQLTVSGIFHIADSGLDSSVAFLNLSDAQKIFNMGNNVSGLRLKVDNLYTAPSVAQKLLKKLGKNYTTSDWTDQYGALFKAIQMEKTMMFVILLFIIAVAAFNLVSSLVMVVNEKQSEIAILRTLGATPKTIMQIFIIQGGIIGLLGTLVGILGGIILALNATYIVAGIENLFHVKFISASVYFINYLPSKLELTDVMHIGLAALILSLGATLYPAWRAAKIKPAEALRYE